MLGATILPLGHETAARLHGFRERSRVTFPGAGQYGPAAGGAGRAGAREKQLPVQDIYRIVTEVIDLRSFSNLWFWIALAVVWSTASHFVLGVPYDMVARARRSGGEAEADLRDIVRINVNRLLYISEAAGLWLMGIACFLLTVLFILGFVYGVEFCQALFLLGFPLSLVFAMSIRTARRIRQADGEGLHRMLGRHRMAVQGIGMVSIFLTALWGMWQNMVVGPL